MRCSFLDYPAKVCLDGVRTRMGKPRPDMPWIEQEYDEEFIQFIKSFKTERCPQIYALLEKYRDKPKVVFKTRAEAEEFLEAVRDKNKIKQRHGALHRHALCGIISKNRTIGSREEGEA